MVIYLSTFLCLIIVVGVIFQVWIFLFLEIYKEIFLEQILQNMHVLILEIRGLIASVIIVSQVTHAASSCNQQTYELVIFEHGQRRHDRE